MVTKIKGYLVFYRHMFYGSALFIVGLAGIFMNNFVSWMHIAFLTSGIILMLISIMITYAVNKYPEDFKDYL